MASAQGIIRVHQHQQAIAFQVEGRALMNQGLRLRRFAEQCFAGGATSLRIDLRHCTYMDSTFLGTLLFLKRAADRRTESEFTLVCPSPECSRLFQQMGLEGVLPILTAEEPATAAWTELTGEAEDINLLKRGVVQAHKELADLAGPAGEPFRAVVRCLAQAGEAEESA